jgi:hypothetical protein
MKNQWQQFGNTFMYYSNKGYPMIGFKLKNMHTERDFKKHLNIFLGIVVLSLLITYTSFILITSNFNPVQWSDSIKTLSNISLLIIFYINFKLLSKE